VQAGEGCDSSLEEQCAHHSTTGCHVALCPLQPQRPREQSSSPERRRAAAVSPPRASAAVKQQPLHSSGKGPPLQHAATAAAAAAAGRRPDVPSSCAWRPGEVPAVGSIGMSAVSPTVCWCVGVHGFRFLACLRVCVCSTGRASSHAVHCLDSCAGNPLSTSSSMPTMHCQQRQRAAAVQMTCACCGLLTPQSQATTGSRLLLGRGPATAARQALQALVLVLPTPPWALR
jgi:hypothetical protein